MQHVSNIQQLWEVGQQCCTGLNLIQTGGLLRLPLAKKLNKFKTVQARTTKLSDFPKIHLGKFLSLRDVYVNINVTMSTEF